MLKSKQIGVKIVKMKTGCFVIRVHMHIEPDRSLVPNALQHPFCSIETTLSMAGCHCLSLRFLYFAMYPCHMPHAKKDERKWKGK
jgi:hypothetical protein